MSNENRPLSFLEKYLARQNFKYHYKTHSVMKEGLAIDPRVLMAEVRLAAFASDEYEIKPMLADAFLVWKEKEAEKWIQCLRDSISFSGASDEIEKWVKAATGEVSSLDVAVVEHFIWQVKRKIHGLPVSHHMMPVLYGKSGGGKSVAVLKLLDPIISVVVNTDMGIFNDSFSKRSFLRNFVMFFDELAGVETIDVDLLKQSITSPTIEWRMMRSEGTFSGPQNCTFIACSNTHLRERIVDPTSARRFWQINCQDTLNWDLINSIDYLALWQSVDEKLDSPIVALMDQIRILQERELKARGIIEEWLEEACGLTEFYSDSPTTKDLFHSFMEWCRWQDRSHTIGLQIFSRSLVEKGKSVGIQILNKKTNRGTVWNLKVT